MKSIKLSKKTLQELVEKEPDGKRVLVSVLSARFPDEERKDIEETANVLSKLLAIQLYERSILSFITVDRHGNLHLKAYTLEDLKNNVQEFLES